MTNRRVLQVLLLIMILTSTTMLAISINHFYLIPIAFVATFGAFWLTDVLKWISIEGWIANVASIGILAYSMYEFYPADSAGKLIAVAKLLVYLQAVLVFQVKTPRLNWQIMVLSLLQVVITTIFSIQFEGGLLFLIYFLVSGLTLVLQNCFSNDYAIEERNEASLESRKQIEENTSTGKKLAFWRYDSRPLPTVTSLEATQKFQLSPLGMLPGVGLVAAMFTLVVFLTAPRHVDPWFSPISYKVNSTGITKQVDLEETGKITNSKQRIFEAEFYPSAAASPEPLQLSQLPYFRGIALSNLTFNNGKTNWNAAYERVNSHTYQSIRDITGQADVRYATMNVTLEKTTEPLLYTVMPAGISENTNGKLKFCHEISAFTRCRENEKIDFAPFSYELIIPLSRTNVPAQAWPYVSNTYLYANKPMANDPAQYRWLTRIDPQNYPTLVETANRISRKVNESNGSRFDLVRAIEDHFLDPSRYSYTLDYTDVKRNLDIDPNEDFVANFRTGHCEAFASAMTLMLRSQGIPSRLVVGFHGGEYNEYSQSYIVRAQHAHAWVEVYLDRNECEIAGLESWQYGDGGAWLMADPTPTQPGLDDGIGADDAIELARTVWQDYVLGMEPGEDSGEEATMTAAVVSLLDKFDLDEFSDQLAASREHGLISILQPLVVVLLIVAGLIGMLRVLIVNAGYQEKQPETAVGKIKRFFADAIGLISSDLREWVIGYDSETAFYKKLSDILKDHDLIREHNQTHREFASEVSSTFASHPSSDLISSSLKEITDAFNRVRFGLQSLDSKERSSIESQLVELERALKVKPGV
ncbi:transglutaminase TgpA family protein [Mariniblastus fucicola]|uniref:Protein-glutamine gamma-glutamyltransferase n=1 Tax=Mariniblastus fucicola TaxID=980251 RepID=A0A5B9PDV1_9BACT|nr:DUF3488 and transglutaminase-like domain-containing protein [Mariniblastus fucicola]QEG24464.1 Protein-glutamine gamma-glutamyltransferase [Mariniblastus fucicola]